MSTLINSIYQKWQFSGPGITLQPGNGYINNVSTGAYLLPYNPNIGDTYIIQGLANAFSVYANTIGPPAEQFIYWKNSTGSLLSTAEIYAGVTLVCITVDPVKIFAVTSTNASVFTLA